MKKFKEVKISKIEYLSDLETTYDVQIEDSHHYLLKSGIVSHNTQDMFPQTIMAGGEGLYYAASVILLLSDAKLKTGEEGENDLGRSGSVITAKSAKNRIAKPKKVKFEIDYSKGINPYKGLEIFCTQENFDKVGIAKVKKVIDKSTGEITYQQSNRWYVRHLDTTIADKQLYNRKVFNSTVLEALEGIVFDYFKYPSYDECLKEIEEIDEKLNGIEDKDDMLSSEEFDLDNDESLFD